MTEAQQLRAELHAVTMERDILRDQLEEAEHRYRRLHNSLAGIQSLASDALAAWPLYDLAHD